MSIFRQYDIRGVADIDLKSEIIWSLGRALAEKLTELGEKGVFIGQDVRESSPRLSQALILGLEAGGIKTRALTPGPTPMLYFLCHKNPSDFESSSGIMITGSHNPAEYNGFKMVLAGKTIYGDEITALEALTKKYLSSAPTSFDKKLELRDHEDLYVNYLKENIRNLEGRLHVVVDAGNGAAGPLAIKSYEAIGAKVTPLFCDFDSTFPNHHPDPTVAENLAHLISKVKEVGADLGIAYDGDGDRIGAVTATGQVLYGDHLVLYFAREIIKDCPHPTIISEVKSSQVLFNELQRMGAKPIIWKTGHSLIKAKLKETKAELAGEMSGHIFFSHRYFGFDDAIYSGARLLEGILNNTPETLDQFLSTLPEVINTPELRVDCPDDKKFGVVDAFIKIAKERYPKDVLDIDGARIKLFNGWGLMRASNTQPVVVMRFEADSKENLKKVRDTFAEIIHSIDATLVVPTL
ncbi:phosphomannomutase/phosphoglucomutase [bacterium]|nr:phosphomannomutase/phosphoglucomutase [bacterium]